MSNTALQYWYRVMLVHGSVGSVTLHVSCNVKYSDTVVALGIITVLLQGDAFKQ